jgi:Cu+-exporting ATPase
VLLAQPGVSNANVNLVHERAEVLVRAGTPIEALCDAVERAGYAAAPAHAQNARALAHEDDVEFNRQARREGWLTLVSLLLTVPLLWPMMLMLFGSHRHLDAGLQLLLATPVQFWLGARFYRAGFASLRAGTGSMDTLVALGTSAAYFYSCSLLLQSGGHANTPLYFEASATVITLVRLGKWLELRAKRSTTSALRGLMALQPECATVRRQGHDLEVPIEEVSAGEIVLVRPGQRVAVDGVIVEGQSDLDESLLTGESFPVLKRAGNTVTGGTLNGNGLLVVQATRVGQDSTLSRIIQMVYGAQASKAPIQRLVDRVSSVFVPVVLAIAGVTFIAWWLIAGRVDAALVAAVSVLVIACPCALGLATPTAIVAGTGAAARAGILVRDVDVLERIAKIDTVVFDKTGTLTQGQPALVDMVAQGVDRQELLRLAASVQQGSVHPLAKATCAAADTSHVERAPLAEFRNVTGHGVSAEIAGTRVLVGNPDWVATEGIDLTDLREPLAAFEARHRTTVVVSRAGVAVGLLGFEDPIRPSAKEVVARLRARGLRVLLLSGDSTSVVRSVAQRLGIDEAEGRVLPQGKQSRVHDLQQSGRHVAMVGDGLNDAPALAEAEVGIAISGGTDVAQHTARVVLMRPDLALVIGVLQVAHATLAKIKQNLFWAFIYNCVGLPLAALGRLDPMLAGLAMALSSVSVVSNSLLLRRWRPRLSEVPSPARAT